MVIKLIASEDIDFQFFWREMLTGEANPVSPLIRTWAHAAWHS
jgi:hypothetical protein